MGEVTTAPVPAVTEIATGLDGFVYDVVQYNNSQANFLDSVAKFANNIIDSVKSCYNYFTHIFSSFAAIVSENPFPACIGSVCAISLFFLMLDFARNRGG